MQRPRWWRRRWLAWTAAVIVGVAIMAVFGLEWGMRQIEPMLRRKVVETLSARFHSPVELDRLSLSMSRGVMVTGGGLRINVPPKGERGVAMPDGANRRGQPRLGIAVDTIECTDAKVVIETSAPGKKPLEFAISRLVLTDVGAMQPLNYEAVLVNPRPVGKVRSTGHFGPWQDDNPRDTPLDGSYEFTHADLSSIHGISGILSSTGTFGGTLGKIAVEGVTDTPDFRLDVSDHAMALHTEFHAVVDGMTGDTWLNAVRARVGRSELTAAGAVMRSERTPGHSTDLHVVMEKGRIEDMLALGLKANPTLMRGALALKTHILIPPGPVSVSRKMRLEGTFAIHGAEFNDAQMQQKVDALSMRAQGKPRLANVRDAEVVASSMSGRFSQADGVVQVSELHYEMPGAQVQMEGRVELVASTFEFHGKVRTEATASQMTTGWKSLLLSPFDKLLKKNGAGLELPIKVTGTRSMYDLRLDFPHDTRAPVGVGSPPK